MNDAPTRWLVEQLKQHASSKSLWFSDENALHELPNANNWPEKPTLISNRWDIAQEANRLGFTAVCSDFDLSHLTDNSIDNIFYRISKEKAITHHLINQAQRLLKANGSLWICGEKNEGIKTYIEKACKLFNCEKIIQKDGINYFTCIRKKSASAGNPLLDDNYPVLRECFLIKGAPVFSKPGQFGWSKIDQGSAFLIEEVEPLIRTSSVLFERCLDLGCGYGYLTLASKEWPIKERVLTDNNAAALTTAAFNCAAMKLNARVQPSDAGKELTDTFELILCNPPFHQGFNVDGDLTHKFLQNTQKLLTQDGAAYFVVNQFIPLEKKAAPFFKQIKLIAKNKSFSVFELRKK